MTRAPAVDPAPTAGAPATVAALVGGFTEQARAASWDTFTGSTGKCWLIHHAFALYAAAAGTPVELWRLANPRSTRTADNVAHVAVVNGWVIDFASRGGMGTEDAPWPVVAPLPRFLAHYGEREPLCPVCGSPGDPDNDGRLSMAAHRCAGLLLRVEHEAHTRALWAPVLARLLGTAP